MRITLFFLLLLLSIRIQAQQDDAPVVGVSDKRVEIYGLKNARVVVDFQTTLENTDILISNGRIEAIGTNLIFPKGTIVYDLTGKTIYPSFIDAYAGNFGIKIPTATTETNPYAAFFNPPQAGRAGTQVTTPEARIADYWNDGINASYDISSEFIPDSKTAAEYRQIGFGAVVAFKADGIARGTSALVSTGDGKANNVILKNKTSANYSIIRGRSSDLYPASQFGIIALLRQVNYDAQWYKQLPAGYFHDDGLEAYTASLTLPQIFEVTNKLEKRWGYNAEELKVENQPGFLKHALGENVKRATNRYPNTRMGTEQIIRDAYQRAVDYNKKWKEWNATKPADRVGKVPPRRDLELDPIVDVLEKRSFIECHTYVQSEGTMIMNIAKEFGVKVNSLIHFNEGYKIADQIVENGAAASVFSDWWDYKYEVYEGIAYNAAMLMKQGVLTCIHSDDAEMGRRLNQEAAKTMKYGGISETDALKLVTINPAIMLHLGDRTGSIKEGKDADLVLWTGYPLSVYARASKTMVDGTIYFDEEQDAKMKEQIDNERNRIIAYILKEIPATSSTTPNLSRR